MYLNVISANVTLQKDSSEEFSIAMNQKKTAQLWPKRCTAEWVS